MEERSGRVVRPLLHMTREETAAYCRERGLPWVEDPSNASDALCPQPHPARPAPGAARDPPRRRAQHPADARAAALRRGARARPAGGAARAHRRRARAGARVAGPRRRPARGGALRRRHDRAPAGAGGAGRPGAGGLGPRRGRGVRRRGRSGARRAGRGPRLAPRRPHAAGRPRRLEVAAGPVHRPQGPARAAPPRAGRHLRRRDRLDPRRGRRAVHRRPTSAWRGVPRIPAS